MRTLKSARAKLDYELTEYLNACTALANYGPTPSLNSQDLCNGMDAEIELLASFEERIAQIRTDLSKARNSLSVLVNSLPNQILDSIFQFATNMEADTSFDELVDGYELPTKILAISQVCARWRRMALGSKNLWTHVNLSDRDALISLGKLFATHSGDLPLSIRVVERLESQENWDNDHLREFFQGIGHRLVTLELAFAKSMTVSAGRFRALQNSLIHCTPGQLTQLIISDRNRLVGYELPEKYYNSGRVSFIIPGVDFKFKSRRDTLQNDQHLWAGSHVLIDISLQDLENIFLPIKVLKLDQIYPLWSSKAYHGLVELRLTGPRRSTPVITEREFANILAASPGLRILHFGLEVTPGEVASAPIRLEELEVFFLQSFSHNTQQTVLRLIVPGGKPLQMSTTYNEQSLFNLPARDEEEFHRFFNRSNIEQLQVHSNRIPVQLPQLLELLPNLEILILRRVTLEELNLPDQDDSTSPMRPYLHSIHFVSCEIDMDVIRWVINTHNLQEVTIWGSSLPGHGGQNHRRVEDSKDEFADISPPVHILDHTSDPIFGFEGWGWDIEDRMTRSARTGYDTSPY